MNLRFRTTLLTLLILLSAFRASAGNVADALNGENKIWVVVLVLATIFAGIIAFLIYLERRIARLEREQGES